MVAAEGTCGGTEAAAAAADIDDVNDVVDVGPGDFGKASLTAGGGGCTVSC